jgi:hypothetical protein
MNYFVIQCYGKERILREAKFCVLSLLQFIKGNANYKIVLYTDNPAFFDDINQYVICEPLLPETAQQWKGEHNFVHRVKIMMLLNFTAKYEGKLIYLDSDTWFKTSPEELFAKVDNQNALMHLPEAQLKSNANPIIKKIHHFVKANTFALANGDKVTIPADYYMWNAGVIGLTTQARPIIEKVLQLTDAMLAAYQKHVMEQLAFSYFLQKEFTAHRCDDAIEHYWPYCAIAEQPMVNLFTGLENQSVDDKIKAVAQFDWSFTKTLPTKNGFWKKLKKKLGA